MKTSIKAITACAMTALLTLGVGPASRAQNEGHAITSAASLLQGVANVASGLARRDAQQGRIESARTWEAWASLYRAGAVRLPAHVTAQQWLAATLVVSRQMAAAAEARGAAPYARLLQASAAMWQDVASQVARGGGVTVRFPDEMLVPIPGAPGTPWQQAQMPQQRPIMATPPTVSAPSNGHWLDQFTPWWMKNGNNNPLATSGVPSGLLGKLGNLSTLGDTNSINEINQLLRRAQAAGNLSGGMAAQNNVYNQVGNYQIYRRNDQAAFEALLRLYQQNGGR